VTESKQLLLVLLFLFLLEVFESFSVRKEATNVFSPKAGWRLFYLLMIAGFVFPLIQHLEGMSAGPRDLPVWVCVLLLFGLLFARPRTLAINSAGISSYSLYGLRHTFIPWTQVSSVTSDWQEEGGGLWRWMARGYSVTVTGRDGTSIEHTLYLRHQGRFLDDLRQRVPAVAFAPGLFDWHP
jgi:hypothetical protein